MLLSRLYAILPTGHFWATLILKPPRPQKVQDIWRSATCQDVCHCLQHCGRVDHWGGQSPLQGMHPAWRRCGGRQLPGKTALLLLADITTMLAALASAALGSDTCRKPPCPLSSALELACTAAPGRGLRLQGQLPAQLPQAINTAQLSGLAPAGSILHCILQELWPFCCHLVSTLAAKGAKAPCRACRAVP